MAFGSMGVQKSDSSSEQSSGLLPNERAYFSGQAPRLFGGVESFSRQARRDPGGLEFLNIIDNNLLPLDEYGLPRAATAGVRQFGRDIFSNASAARAQRGFGTAAGLESVLGDAVRMASGSLIPLSTEVALKRAAMAPALRQAKFGYQMTPMQTLQQLLSASSAGRSESSAFGFQAAGGKG